MNTLVVALGNPGIQYELTRHNIGWCVLDQLDDQLKLVWQKKFKGLFATAQEHLFLKPQTFMNLSGESVVQAINFYKISIDNLIVIHDDIDIPFGTIAFKKGGGDGGHNGLKSISQLTGNSGFMRMRLGIGRPPHGQVSSWVLSSYSETEETHLEQFFTGAADALAYYLQFGFEKAASKFSRKNLISLE